ncbi:MAG: carbohydrate ABC transporter permease [Chloroflexota bacterium]|nr:carbohydrate ABC transporter permease [Chloroflexota bacterium]
MRKITLGAILRHGILLFSVAFTLLPLLFTFLTSLKLFRDVISGSLLFRPTLRNYQILFNPSQTNFTRLTLNSIVTSSGTTLLVLFIATLTAYSLSRFPWRRLWSSLIMGWLLFMHMLPPITYVTPFYLLTRSIGIYDTPAAVIMGHIVLQLPTAVWMLYDFFAEVPKELEEAALVDGSSRWQAFWRVILPLTAPGLAAAAVLVFVFSWRDFLFALSLTSTPHGMTVPVGIAGFVHEYNIRYGEMAAASFFATLPSLLLVTFAQRYIVKGLTLGALKG